MRCATAQADLTALIDGALPSEAAAGLQAHVDSCPSCRRELHSLRDAVVLQSRVLAPPLPELSLGFETRLRQRLVEAAEERAARQWFPWLWKPVTATALAAASILMAAGPLGGPSAVLVPLGIQAPPPKLATKPELFEEYPIIEHLDELEHFETVDAIRLEDELRGKARGSG
jgi:anti-sigma factor RsiW